MSDRPAPALPRQAAAALTTLIWGSTFLAISIGNDAAPPVWAAALRLGLAAVLLTAIAAARRQPLPRGRALETAVLYGVFQFGMNFPLLYWAEARVPSGLCAVIFATTPLNTAILAHAFGLERLTATSVAGALTALAGVALIFSAQLKHAVEPLRLVAVLAATWAASLGTVTLKRGPRQSPIAVNAIGAVVGGAMCALLSGALGEPHALPTTPAALFPILYLTVAGSVGAFVLWAWLIHHSNITRLSYISVVVPVVALALGLAVRHEPLPVAGLAGSLVVLAGVALGLRRPAAPRDAAELAPPSVAE